MKNGSPTVRKAVHDFRFGLIKAEEADDGTFNNAESKVSFRTTAGRDMHQRLANELVLRLARRALSIIAPCLREEEHRDAFSEFHDAFKEELLRYEDERERMLARLRGNSTDERIEVPALADGAEQSEQNQIVDGHPHPQ